MIFLTLFVIPFLVALGFWAFAKDDRGRELITWKEFLVQVGAQALVALLSLACIWGGDTHDVELWNGRVANKASYRVSCEHSYTCNCVTTCSGSGSNRSCTEICQTCYEHSYDVSWYLHTTNEESIVIERVDRRGTSTPPRWASARVGDPTAIRHSFTNYVKAAPDTLFRRRGLVERYATFIPAYPIAVHDYHYANRLVQVSTALPDAAAWNADLMQLNADLGRSKEVNIVVVTVASKESEYGLALEQAWLGGKKNDVVVVVGLDGTKVSWTHVMSWSTNQMLQVALRDQLLDLGTFDRERAVPVIRKAVSDHFRRKHFREFAYLASCFTPTGTQYLVSIIIGVVASIGISLFMAKEDLFQ